MFGGTSKVICALCPSITEDERMWLFSVAIRDLTVFADAMPLIREEHFDETEQWLHLIWRIVKEHFATTGELPSQRVISTKCNSELEINPSCIPEGHELQINAFLKWAFRLKDEDMPVRVALDVLQRFLKDRLVKLTYSAFSMRQTPSSLPAVFAGLGEQALALANISAGNLEEPFAQGWNDVMTFGERIPTNVSFLDEYLDGGASPGDAYAILGPCGGGKTTLGIMITTMAARDAYQAWCSGGQQGLPARAYHFHYDDRKGDIQLLALSFMAQIPRTRVETFIQARGDFSVLSTTGNYQPYELQKWGNLINAGTQMPGELERYTEAVNILNTCWRPIDMTGSDHKNPGRGTGLVDEMSQIVSRDVSRSGNRVRTVLADDASAAARAHFGATGRDRNEMRLVLQDWPFDMKRKLAIKFHCPVWTVQQLDKLQRLLPNGPAAARRAVSFYCPQALLGE
jgi:hypothetical protein